MKNKFPKYNKDQSHFFSSQIPNIKRNGDYLLFLFAQRKIEQGLLNCTQRNTHIHTIFLYNYNVKQRIENKNAIKIH